MDIFVKRLYKASSATTVVAVTAVPRWLPVLFGSIWFLCEIYFFFHLLVICICHYSWFVVPSNVCVCVANVRGETTAHLLLQSSWFFYPTCLPNGTGFGDRGRTRTPQIATAALFKCTGSLNEHCGYAQHPPRHFPVVTRSGLWVLGRTSRWNQTSEPRWIPN